MSDKFSFFTNLKAVLDIVLSAGLKRVLVGAGVGLVTGAVMLVVFNYYVTMLVNEFQAIDSSYVGLLGLMGVDKAVSIIIGAYAVRLTILVNMRLGLRRNG